VGAIQKRKQTEEKFKEKGSELAESQLVELSTQLSAFQTNLETFARNHKDEIRRDPEFRRHFQEMCATIGVDPLASGKGFWSNMLDLGDFYYELGVQVVEVCMAASHRTGGLLSLEELRVRLVRARGRSMAHQDITKDDLLRAIKKLQVLGKGFSLIELGSGNFLVQSVPGEVSLDQVSLLSVADGGGGCVSESKLGQQLGWNRQRAGIVIQQMMAQGLLWLDEQGEENEYWVPSIFSANVEGAT